MKVTLHFLVMHIVLAVMVCLVLGAQAKFDGSISFDLRELMPTIVNDTFIPNCLKNYGIRPVNALKNALDTHSECIFNQVTTALSADLTAVVGGYEYIVPMVCSKMYELRNCGGPLISSLKSCANPVGGADIEKIESTAFQVAKFLCNSDGARIIEFMAQDGQECFAGKKEQLRACLEPVSKMFLSFEKGIFNVSNCRIEENSTNCALTTLKTCKHLTTANLAQEIIELIRKETCVFKGNGAFKPTVSNNFSFVIFTYLLYQQLFY